MQFVTYMGHSKRYNELKKQIEKDKIFSLPQAVELTKKTATTKFDSAIELHLNLGIDPKKGDQQIRSTVILPHGIGKEKKIAVFTSDDKTKEAKEAGADLVGGQELIDEIKKTSKINFDIAVASPEMMPKLAPIAKILGPKGLMPSPKNETITSNIKKTVAELKKGKIAFKNDDTANIHQVVGKSSFDDKKLIENIQTFLEAVQKAKPEGTKGIYIKSMTLTSTMGPAIKFEIK